MDVYVPIVVYNCSNFVSNNRRLTMRYLKDPHVHIMAIVSWSIVIFILIVIDRFL